MQGWLVLAIALAWGVGGADAHAQIPQSLRSDHAEMQAELLKWLGTPSAVGLAAGHLSNALIEHFAAENEAVCSILGLLYTLASDGPIENPEAALARARELPARLPALYAQHAAIIRSLQTLRQAPGVSAELGAWTRAAERHTLLDEEVLYPAALLAARDLKARFTRGRVSAGATDTERR
jgi:hypothetical protein